MACKRQVPLCQEPIHTLRCLSCATIVQALDGPPTGVMLTRCQCHVTPSAPWTHCCSLAKMPHAQSAGRMPSLPAMPLSSASEQSQRSGRNNPTCLPCLPSHPMHDFEQVAHAVRLPRLRPRLRLRRLHPPASTSTRSAVLQVSAPAAMRSQPAALTSSQGARHAAGLRSYRATSTTLDSAAALAARLAVVAPFAARMASSSGGPICCQNG